MTTMDTVTAPRTAPAPAPARPRRRRRPALVYAVAALVILAATAWALRLWRADWQVPFFWSSDAISSAGHFKTTLSLGWYENQPDLGFPYGQHYHDFPFSDDLQPAVIKVLGLFVPRWEVLFNLYYVAGFVLDGLAGLWFLRRCRLSDPLAVALAVLYALAPYHFFRNEIHYFLSEYWMVPLAMGVVLSVLQGRTLWGPRHWRPDSRIPAGMRRVLGPLTGRGAGTVAVMVLTPYSGAYYGAFTAVLLACAVLVAAVRRFDRARLLGAVGAGAVLVGAFVCSMIPDVLYARSHGSDAAAFVRGDGDAEVYSLKFMQLILPPYTYPIKPLAFLRDKYEGTFPDPGENPALGTAATVGFLLLLGVLLLALLNRWGRPGATPARHRRGTLLLHLAVLSTAAFLFSTVGGFDALVGLLTSSIRAWNRLVIFLALFALAGLGLLLEGAAERIRPVPVAGPAGRRQIRARVRSLAAVVLVLGVLDQSLVIAVPAYAATAATFNAEQQFVDELQARLPAGAALFELPYIAWPESPTVVAAVDNDQLRLFLHSTTLRWSGGGIKGRPQVDWARTVAGMAPEPMVNDLAVIGFAGIVVDRYGYTDSGRGIEAGLHKLLGGTALVSPDGRWSFLSLAPAVAGVERRYPPARRAALAAQLTHAAG